MTMAARAARQPGTAALCAPSKLNRSLACRLHFWSRKEHPMPMPTNRWAGFVLGGLIALIPLPAAAQAQSPAPKSPPAKTQPAGPANPVNEDARILADFQKRVDTYLGERKQAQKDAPALKPTEDPTKIKVAENILATRIRTVRAKAQPGDIFTPEIQLKFRRLLSPELKGEDGRDAKQVLKDDAPAGVPLKVNADYPEGKSLPTVPAALLGSLPTLPKELEYRIIDRNLILRDTEANLIVDFIPNAIPAKS